MNKILNFMRNIICKYGNVERNMRYNNSDIYEQLN